MTDRERLLREWPTCRGWWVTQATHDAKRCERPAGHDGACATFLCQGDKEFVESLTASARDGARVAPIYRCPLGEHDVFTYPDGKIVPHFADDGTKCLASYRVLTNPARDGALSSNKHVWGCPAWSSGDDSECDCKESLAGESDGALTSAGEGMAGGPGEPTSSPPTSPAPQAGEWPVRKWLKENGYDPQYQWFVDLAQRAYAAGAAASKPITGEMVRKADDCWSGYGPGTYAEHMAKVLNALQRVKMQARCPHCAHVFEDLSMVGKNCFVCNTTYVIAVAAR